MECMTNSFGNRNDTSTISVTLKAWSHRLSVRTSGFHPGKRSSTLLGVTKVKSSTFVVGLFTLVVLEENRTPNEVSVSERGVQITG